MQLWSPSFIFFFKFLFENKTNKRKKENQVLRKKVLRNQGEVITKQLSTHLRHLLRERGTKNWIDRSRNNHRHHKLTNKNSRPKPAVIGSQPLVEWGCPRKSQPNRESERRGVVPHLPGRRSSRDNSQRHQELESWSHPYIIISNCHKAS